MKKGLKIGLIIGASILVVGGAWAGLTKTGIIPNWLEINLWDVDCKGEVFRGGEIPTKNGRKCKEGTYKKIIFTQGPECPGCQ